MSQYSNKLEQMSDDAEKMIQMLKELGKEAPTKKSPSKKKSNSNTKTRIV